MKPVIIIAIAFVLLIIPPLIILKLMDSKLF